MKLVHNARVVARVGAEVRAVDMAAEVVVDAAAMAEAGAADAGAEDVVETAVTVEVMAAGADETANQDFA